MTIEKFRVLDFETTGIPSEDDPHAVVEFGFYDVMQRNGVWYIGKGVEMLVNPLRPIPAEAMAIHHITDKDIELSFAFDAAEQVINHGMDVGSSVFVAHNANFEQSFFKGNGAPWICTLKCAYRAWPDAPSHSNQVLRYFLGIDLDPKLALPAHRALPDAYVTSHILMRLLEKDIPIQDMIRWSSGPALLPKINFGKHKGKKWEDVPTDYLQWLAFKSDMDDDVKANARHHLKKM